MNLWLSSDNPLNLESLHITLRAAQPVLNGALLQSWVSEVVRADDRKIQLHHTSPALGEGIFQLQATRLDHKITIGYWIEGLPPHDRRGADDQ